MSQSDGTTRPGRELIDPVSGWKWVSNGAASETYWTNSNPYVGTRRQEAQSSRSSTDYGNYTTSRGQPESPGSFFSDIAGSIGQMKVQPSISEGQHVEASVLGASGLERSLARGLNGIKSGLHSASQASLAQILDPEYKVPKSPFKFFREGKVFLTLWSEPNSSSSTGSEVTVGVHEGNVYSTIRRFVVIRESKGSCAALQISTYGRKGLSKPGVHKSDHAIIFTGENPPTPLSEELPRPGEAGMQPIAVRVMPSFVGEKLDPLSRINLGKIYTIEHNIKVRVFGIIENFPRLQKIHQSIWFRKLSPQPFIYRSPSSPRTKVRGHDNAHPIQAIVGIRAAAGASERPPLISTPTPAAMSPGHVRITSYIKEQQHVNMNGDEGGGDQGEDEDNDGDDDGDDDGYDDGDEDGDGDEHEDE